MPFDSLEPHAKLALLVPHPPCIHRRHRNQVRQGLSLVESCALISLFGVLLAAFVPTFLREVRLSKISEATSQLALMHQATAAYYEQSQRVAGKLRQGCLPKSAGPTPAAPSPTPIPVDFGAPEQVGFESWKALGIGMIEARYSYSLIVALEGCGPRVDAPSPLVTFRAEGDLDGDGERSVLQRSASPSADQSRLEPGGILDVQRRVE